VNAICLYYDCSWQLSYFVGIFLTKWFLHTHSEAWQHFQSILLSLTVEQIENLPTKRTPSTPSSSVFLHSCRGFQVLSIALMALRICLSTFRLSALIVISSLKPFLLPGKADTDVFDYSSIVANWDTSASTVQMHLHKQKQSNWRIVS